MLSTKYRDDKRSRERADIIHDLDPLPGKSISEAIEIFKAGGIGKINFIIKSNLSNFIRRFERENIDIVRFGSLGNYQRKIDQINESLVEYAKLELNTQPNEKIIGEASGDIRPEIP